MTVKNKLKIALIGNPNSGKTTLFNALTGSNQYVGNWPGVTVEKKSGIMRHNDYELEIIDLPGIYSLNAQSLDEKIARNFIVNEKPDLILNIVDAGNMERNLYLTMQILQYRRPVLVALNMIDLLEKMDMQVDYDNMRTMLNCPVLPISATKKEGLTELKDTIVKVEDFKNYISNAKVAYDEVIFQSIDRISKYLQKEGGNDINAYLYTKQPESCSIEDPCIFYGSIDQQYFLLRLLEQDELIVKNMNHQFTSFVNREREKIAKHTRMQTELLIADGIYGYVRGLCKDVISRKTTYRKKNSDSLDQVFLNSIFGLPMFIFIMYLVFSLSMTFSDPFIGFIESFFGGLFVDGTRSILTMWNFPEFLKIFIADGIGGGLMTVLSFVPPIFFIFLCLSILEDSGYMARAAFVMDRVMRHLGLSGKAVIPMIVGFGCTVPAIMATRTLDSKRDRVMTILLLPFIQCGAKIPVYTMFAMVFFRQYAGIAIFLIYLLGIFFAFISAILFKKLLFIGHTGEFVMELPSYHLPTWNGIFTHTWFKLKSFIFRAGKTILIVMILMTLVNSLPLYHNEKDNITETPLTLSGKFLTPLFKPMGIDKDNWHATLALFTGFFAKEAIVGTFEGLNLSNTLSEGNDSEGGFSLAETFAESVGELKDGFVEAFHKFINPLHTETVEVEETDEHYLKGKFKSVHQVIAYLLFIMIYAPCMASIVAARTEAGSRLAIFQLIYLTVLAWIVGTFYYQISQLGNGVSWEMILPIVLSFGLIILIKYYAKDENKLIDRG
ncbi:MAG TPA: ferrous iron transport protein B [Candidatus Cloacimonadota bacterium]|nr:ferrous iron transport protein B [Candidatus Cloacimonadota bacterium]